MSMTKRKWIARARALTARHISKKKEWTEQQAKIVGLSVPKQIETPSPQVEEVKKRNVTPDVCPYCNEAKLIDFWEKKHPKTSMRRHIIHCKKRLKVA